MPDVDPALRVAAWKYVYDYVRDQYGYARQLALEAMTPGDRKMARTPEGDAIGSVTVVQNKPSPKVINERAFLEWVKASHPGEVETVERVSDVWRSALLSYCLRSGDQAVEPRTGELIPGVAFVVPEPYAKANPPTPAQRETFARRWMENRLGLPLLLPAPAPEPFETPDEIDFDLDHQEMP
jgi:hypothetical protein